MENKLARTLASRLDHSQDHGCLGLPLRLAQDSPVLCLALRCDHVDVGWFEHFSRASHDRL